MPAPAPAAPTARQTTAGHDGGQRRAVRQPLLQSQDQDQAGDDEDAAADAEQTRQQARDEPDEDGLPDSWSGPGIRAARRGRD
jgi:hypothetical protein